MVRLCAEESGMKQTIVLILFLAAVGYFVVHGGNFSDSSSDNRSLSATDNATDKAQGQVQDRDPRKTSRPEGDVQGQTTVAIEVLYSDEKRNWIQDAHNRFIEKHPEIQVKLTKMSSVEGAHAIIGGSVAPTIWNPADSIVLNYLTFLWYEKYSERLFAESGRDKPVDLVLSPLVWLVWPDALEKYSTNVQRPWVEIACANIPAKALPVPDAGLVDAGLIDAGAPDPNLADAAVPEVPVFDNAKFHHTSPTYSNSGLQAIYLMIYEYLGRPERLRKSDITAELIEWFRKCEERIPAFTRSTRGLSDSMFRFGREKYEIVVTYEQVAMQLLSEAKGDAPTIYYPPSTMWSGHPIAILQPEKQPEDVLEAARTWIAFLGSDEMQRSALKYGLRPTSPAISIRDDSDVNTTNPFLGLARFNVQPDFESQVPDVPGPAVKELMRLWRSVTGR